MNRRKFIGAFGTTTGIAIAGCTTGEDTDGGNGDDTGTGDGTQAIEISVSGDPDTIHPLEHLDVEGYFISQWTYSNLVRRDHNLEPQADLAEDWEGEDQGRTWTFYLREGATWNHDGSEVTANDVKYTFETIYDPDEDYPGAGEMGPIESIDVQGDYTITFHMEAPDAVVPRKMGSEFGRILPQETLEGDFDLFHNETAGSGPFELTDFSRGSHYTVSAVDDFYLEDENGEPLPKTERITMNVYPETGSEVNALQTQDIDIMQSVPSDQFDLLDEDPNIDALSVDSGWIYPLIMQANEDGGPFEDVRVRQAFKYAADKVEILEVVAGPHGTLAEDNLVPPALPEYADIGDPFGPEARPGEARELLAEAGYPNGLELDEPLYAPGDRTPQTIEIAVLLQEQMAEVDVHFEIQNVSWDRFLSEVTGEAPFYMNSYGMRPAPEIMNNLLTHSEAAWHYDNSNIPVEIAEEYDETVEAAAASLDDEERLQYLEDAQRMMQEHGSMLIPFYENAISASNDYVRDYQVDPTQLQLHAEYVELGDDAPER